jgi:hypothetical protein
VLELLCAVIIAVSMYGVGEQRSIRERHRAMMLSVALWLREGGRRCSCREKNALEFPLDKTRA